MAKSNSVNIFAFMNMSDMAKRDYLEALQRQSPEKYKSFINQLKTPDTSIFSSNQVTQQPSIFNQMMRQGTPQPPETPEMPGIPGTPQAVDKLGVSANGANSVPSKPNFDYNSLVLGAYKEGPVGHIDPATQEPLAKVDLKNKYTPEKIAQINEDSGALSRFWTGNLTEAGDYVGGYGDMITSGANMAMKGYGLYQANKTLDLQKEALDYQKNIDATNLWNQGTAYNDHVRWKQGLNNHMMGKTKAQSQSIFDSQEYKNKLAKKVL